MPGGAGRWRGRSQGWQRLLRDGKLTTQKQQVRWLNNSDCPSSFPRWPRSAFQVIRKPRGSRSTVSEAWTGCGIIMKEDQ